MIEALLLSKVRINTAQLEADTDHALWDQYWVITPSRRIASMVFAQVKEKMET